MTHLLPLHFRGLVATGVLGLTGNIGLAALSTPNYESFESIQVTSGQTPTVTAASAIHVRSNGTAYTQAVGSHVTYLIGGSAKVSSKKWRVFNVQLGIGALAVMNNGTRLNAASNGHFENFGSFHSTGVNQYPTQQYSIQDHPVQVPLGSSGLGHFAVQRCNAHKLGLQQQGVSTLAIFKQSRTISIPVAFHFAAQVNDKDKEEEHSHEGALGHGAGTIALDARYWRQATMWHSVNVVCEKAPELPVAAPTDPTPIPAGPGSIALARGVTQSFLSTVIKNKPAGACSVKLSGVIETNLPNTSVTFAYRNHKGVETPSRTLKTDHSKTVMFVDEIHFAQGKGDGPALTSPVSQPAPGNPANTFAARASDRQYHGWYQIVGKNFSFKSNMAEYSFNCQPKAPGGFQAPGLGSINPPVFAGARAVGPAPVRPALLAVLPALRAPRATPQAPVVLRAAAGMPVPAQGQGGSSCYPGAGPNCVPSLDKACTARRGGMRTNPDGSVTCVVN
ncbi:MAG: hypothetical protein Q8Q82_20970 [Hydrogenophaga sp.]|nr:hypothetical protein [Hydrogenophaga sp.]